MERQCLRATDAALKLDIHDKHNRMQIDVTEDGPNCKTRNIMKSQGITLTRGLFDLYAIQRHLNVIDPIFAAQNLWENSTDRIQRAV